MTQQDNDEYWRPAPGMSGEAPDWVNRDYDEKDEQPKSRRWMVWTVMVLSALFAAGGLWSTLEPLLK